MRAEKLRGQPIRDYLWPTVLLISALALALISTIARRNGLFFAAVLLSGTALLAAIIVCFTLVPRLARRVRLDYWHSFRLFRVTPRGIFFVFLLLLIALATFNTGNNLLILVLSFLLAALIVSGMISNLGLYGLNVRLDLPRSIHAGQTAVLLLCLENMKKAIPSFALTLKGVRLNESEEDATTFFSQQIPIPYVGPKETFTARVESQFHKRGIYPIEGFEVTTKFPFGFFMRGRRVPAEGKITVYPALVPLNQLVRRFPQLQGPEFRNQKGQGTGLYNIRDYRKGDDARFVHWKSTAKLSRLMVKEFLQERDDFLDVVLSTHLPSPDVHAEEQFEKTLSVIASLIAMHHSRGRELRFYSGEFETVLDGNRGRLEDLMDYLAVVHPSRNWLLEGRRITPRSLVFLAGPGAEWRGQAVIDYLRL